LFIFLFLRAAVPHVSQKPHKSKHQELGHFEHFSVHIKHSEMWNALKSDLLDFVTTIQTDTTETLQKVLGEEETEQVT
jgi:hypothetical protein